MRFFNLSDLAGFIESYNYQDIHIKPYASAEFPNFEYKININKQRIDITAAIPIEKSNCGNIIRARIEKKRHSWRSNKQIKHPWLTPQQLQKNLEQLTQLPIRIKENTPLQSVLSHPPQLPFKLNKQYYLGGIQYLSRWSFIIYIGPATYSDYIHFMKYTWLHEKLKAYMNKHVNMLWQYHWVIEVKRETCPLPKLGMTRLGVDCWLLDNRINIEEGSPSQRKHYSFLRINGM